MNPMSLINKINLYIMILMCAVIELILNNISYYLFDFLGIILVILLLNQADNLMEVIVVSLLADLIGRWYLGTHLIAVMLMQLSANYFYNYYRICNFLQKWLILIINYLCLLLIIFLLELIFKNILFNFYGVLIEIFLVIPGLNLCWQKFITSDQEFYFN